MRLEQWRFMPTLRSRKIFEHCNLRMPTLLAGNVFWAQLQFLHTLRLRKFFNAWIQCLSSKLKGGSKQHCRIGLCFYLDFFSEHPFASLVTS